MAEGADEVKMVMLWSNNGKKFEVSELEARNH